MIGALEHTIMLGLYVAALGVGYKLDRWSKRRRETREMARQMAAGGDSEQLNLFEGLRRRAKGWARVEANNGGWMRQAIDKVEAFPDGHEGTGEDIGIHLVETCGLGQPKHANAWGRLFGELSRRKLLVRTGERRPMRRPTSKARMTDVWRKQTPLPAS